MSNVIPLHKTDNARDLINATPPINCRLKKKHPAPILEVALTLILKGHQDSACRVLAASIARLEQ